MLFWPISCPFNPLLPNNLENQNFLKMKKDFCRCHFKLVQQKTRSHDVCLLRYWVLAQTIVSHFRPLFAFFAILPHYWHQKLKFGKNVKKRLEILSFYTCVPLIKIIWCMVPEIWTSTDRMILSLWAIFALLPPPQTTRKIKINKKNEENTWRYHHFTQLYQKLWSYAILFLRYGAWWM